MKTQLKNGARIVLKPDKLISSVRDSTEQLTELMDRAISKALVFPLQRKAGGGVRPARTRAATSWDTSYLGYSGGNGLGRKGDIGFHLMGDQFYGSEYFPKLVPGNSNLNGSGGAFGTLERLWSTAAENGKRVNDVTIDLSYPPNNNLRPNLFQIGFSIRATRYRLDFENRSGQAIDPQTLASLQKAVS